VSLISGMGLDLWNRSGFELYSGGYKNLSKKNDLPSRTITTTTNITTFNPKSKMSGTLPAPTHLIDDQMVALEREMEALAKQKVEKEKVEVKRKAEEKAA
jgi:hypothetical protein